MSQSQYFHCSLAGSYWIDCEVLEKRKYDFCKDASFVDQIFVRTDIDSMPIKVDKGYVIKYFDSFISEEVIKWVPLDMVKGY